MTYLRREQSRLKRLVLPVCLGSVLVSSVFVLSACQLEPTDGSTNNPTQSSEHKHIIGVDFAGSDSGEWPPVALNATNISPIRNYTQGLQAQNLASSVIVKERFDKHNGLRSIRGNRYASFEVDIVDDKEVAGKDSEGVYARTTYFNYVSNLTIDAWIDSNDQIQYSVEPAYTTQPPENREEEAQAVELAKADLTAKGYDVSSLIGTAMLAFPSTSEIAQTGQNFYTERILYATFGQGNGEVPVYTALVNLSQNTVSNSGEVASY